MRCLHLRSQRDFIQSLHHQLGWYQICCQKSASCLHAECEPGALNIDIYCQNACSDSNCNREQVIRLILHVGCLLQLSPWHCGCICAALCLHSHAQQSSVSHSDICSSMCTSMSQTANCCCNASTNACCILCLIAQICSVSDKYMF